MNSNLSSLRKLQLTLAIIKPDVVAHPQRLMEMKQSILEHHFYFVQSQVVRLLRRDAEKFYELHKGKFFFNRLVGFMSSGPISVHILAREGAVAYWRKLMGPTKVFRARFEAPDSLRAHFGLTDTRNATHGSDSPDSVKNEIAFFFPDFSIEDWFQYQEGSFREGNVRFCEKRFEHYAVKDVAEQ